MARPSAPPMAVPAGFVPDPCGPNGSLSQPSAPPLLEQGDDDTSTRQPNRVPAQAGSAGQANTGQVLYHRRRAQDAEDRGDMEAAIESYMQACRLIQAAVLPEEHDPARRDRWKAAGVAMTARVRELRDGGSAALSSLHESLHTSGSVEAAAAAAKKARISAASSMSAEDENDIDLSTWDGQIAAHKNLFDRGVITRAEWEEKQAYIAEARTQEQTPSQQVPPRPHPPTLSVTEVTCNDDHPHASFAAGVFTLAARDLVVVAPWYSWYKLTASFRRVN